MFKYRITKYNPEYRDEKGIFRRNDWTSVSDIGKPDGQRLKTVEYMEMEEKYISMIISFLDFAKAKQIYIKQVEKNFTELEIMNMEGIYNLPVSFKPELYKRIHNNTYLSKEEACDVSRMILREYMWGELHIDSQNCISFGYDYYMYFISSSPCIYQLMDQKPSGIFIEETEAYER